MSLRRRAVAGLLKFITGIALFLVACAVQAKEVDLKWKSIEGAKKYNLEISESADFSKTVYSKSVSEPVLKHDLKSGIYYLRVQGVDKLGRAGAFSSPFKLVVTAPVKPVEDAETPKHVAFVEKKPQLETVWKTTDTATGYKVKIIKDGKELITKETKDPRVEFKPDGPGDYKVVVSSGFDEGSNQYFGPPVTVETLHVERKILLPPIWETPEQKRFSNKRPIDLAWTNVDSAAWYRVKVYKAAEPGSRSPASDEVVFQTDKLENNRLVIDPLPPGKYYASVESMSDDSTAVSSKDISLEVRRSKPIEFEKFDVDFRYNVSQVNYQSNIVEASGYSNANGVGGSVQLDGHMWFPDSHWGLRAAGTWGGFTISGTNVSFNDLSAAGQYRLLSQNDGGFMDVRPYLGARAWSVPIISANGGGGSGGGGGNGGNNGFFVFPITLVGPAFGIDLQKSLSPRLTALGRIELSSPLTNSSIGNGDFNAIQAQPGDMSTRVEVGLKYALPGTIKVLAMAGFTDDELKFNSFAGPNNTGAPAAGVTDYAALKYPSFTLGVETSDDGAASSVAAADRKELFSDVDFTMGITGQIVNYNSSIIENNGNGQNPTVSNQGGGDAGMEAVAWFKESKSGLDFEADWSEFSLLGGGITYPNLSAAWGYRPDTHPTIMGWSWNNFLGLRSWCVPVLRAAGNSGGANLGNQFDYLNPQLLGPQETFVLMKGFSEFWRGKFIASVSTPLLITNKDSTIDHSMADTPSFSAQVQAIRSLSPDFSVGVGAGYSMQELKYVPTVAVQSGGSGYSLVQIGAPTVSLFGLYNF